MNQNLQPTFRALGDITRRQILMALRQDDLTISEVVDKFDLTRTAIRKHLTILEEGGLITVVPRGKERVTRLNQSALRAAAEWFNYFDQYWDSALGSLKNAIESDAPEKTRGKNL